MEGRALARASDRAARDARRRLAEDIARLCADAGISQAQLARTSGVPASFVSRILAGTTRPSLETYARLAVVLGADLSSRLYPTTGPAIHDRLSVPILESLLAALHPRWHPVTEVRVRRPSRGWIDTVLHDPRERVAIAAEIQSALRRIEQLIRWSGEKADGLPSWDGWSSLDEPAISRLLVIRWTRATRDAAKAAELQLRLAYPAHPDDALAALTGTAPWPGAAIIWARAEHGRIRLVGRR